MGRARELYAITQVCTLTACTQRVVTDLFLILVAAAQTYPARKRAY